MSDENTTIQVRREDVDKLREMYPALKNDAYRLAALVKDWETTHATSAALIPHPQQAQK